MPKSKPYMDDLENIEEIQEMDKQTIDLELELDKLNQEKKDIDKKINSLVEKDNSPEHEKKELENQLMALDNKIFLKDMELLRIYESRKEAVRRGLSELYHHAHQEYEKAKMEWIRYSEKALKAHEKLKIKNKEVEAVKNAFKHEFGD